MKRISPKKIGKLIENISEKEWNPLNLVNSIAQEQLDSCEKERFNPDYLKFKDGVKRGRSLQRAIDREKASEIFEKIEEANIVRPYPHSGIVIEEPRWQAIKANFVKIIKEE